MSKTDLKEAVLQGADLSAGHLSGANLSKARLEGSNLLSVRGLSEANLQGTRYDSHTKWPEEFNYQQSGAIGPGAKLAGADLYGKDLLGADLSGADLSEANLDGANLDGSDLSGADLSGVVSFIRSHVYLQEARYTGLTIWPEGFDPESHGAILVET